MRCLKPGRCKLHRNGESILTQRGKEGESKQRETRDLPTGKGTELIKTRARHVIYVGETERIIHAHACTDDPNRP